MEMLEAKQMAMEFLDRKISAFSGRLVILDDYTIETESSWIFFYNTRAWAETKSLDDSLFGNLPIEVFKKDSAIRTVAFSRMRELERCIKDRLGKWT
jgi:hypothetical protein